MHDQRADSTSVPSATDQRRRGLSTLGHPYVTGTVIGAIGASVFVLSNLGLLAPPWPSIALGGYLAALGWYLWTVFMRPRVLPVPQFRRGAGWIYLASVIAMIVGILLGRTGLEGIGRLDLAAAFIAALVGLHFIPFGYAFRAPVFYLLGSSLAVLGVVGVLLGALVGGSVAAGSAVLCGIVMLALMGWDAWRPVGAAPTTERGGVRMENHRPHGRPA
ncbi:MAG: hypothetical protein ACK5MT_13330 [Actinomycetales bacterium]